MDPVEFTDAISTFLHDHMSEMLNRCLNDDEAGRVVRAVQRADAQAIAARNLDFSADTAAVQAAVADAQAAKDALAESLQNVKGIDEILKNLSDVMNFVSTLLAAGV